MEKKFKKFIEILFILYDKYMVNREYKDKSFSTKDDFLNAQKNLSLEIEKNENDIIKLIRKIINDAFPTIEILRYDSRYFKKNRSFLGNILCRGLKDKEESRTIQKYFEAETCFLINVQRIEDFDDKTQQELIKIFEEHPQI